MVDLLDFWLPWELRDSYYALDWLEMTYALLYGAYEEVDASCN